MSPTETLQQMASIRRSYEQLIGRKSTDARSAETLLADAIAEDDKPAATARLAWAKGAFSTKARATAHAPFRPY